MRTIIDDRQSIGKARKQRMKVSGEARDQSYCCQCGFTFSSSDYTGKSIGSIDYCRQCGLVAVPAIGIVIKDKQELHKGKEQPSADAMTSLQGSRFESADMLSRRWISYSKATNQTEKNVAVALAEITRLVSALSLQPNIASRAADICIGAFEKGVSKGSSLQTLAAAATYASARLAALPVTIEDVVDKAKLPKSNIIRCFRKIQRELDLCFRAPSPADYAPKIMTLCAVAPDSAIASVTKEIIEAADKSGHTQGRNPSAIAAAAIYMASQKISNAIDHEPLLITQRRLAQAANVTETTIRRACHNLDLGL